MQDLNGLLKRLFLPVIVLILVVIGALVLRGRLGGSARAEAQTDAAATRTFRTESDDTAKTEAYVLHQTKEAESKAAASKGASGKQLDEEPPREDPQKKGFYYDEKLTEDLFDTLAIANTNNTDLSSTARTMTAEFYQRLECLSLNWFWGNISTGELAERMSALEFDWPDITYIPRPGVRNMEANIYEFSGHDFEKLLHRIMYVNLTARHYLFMRVYYSETEDLTRIYMVNGLVW